MRKIGLWWVFLGGFALMIGGILSIGWWTRPTATMPQASQSNRDPFTTSDAARHFTCQPKHWRTLVMQQ